MKNIKHLSALLMAVVLCLCSLVVVPAFASSTGYGTAVFGGNQTGTSETTDADANTSSSSSSSGFWAAMGEEDPNVTTDDVNNWVDRKGDELISIITRVVRIVAVIGFFLCLFLIIVGAVGNKRTMVGGLIGLIISCVCFTAATMGPQLVIAIQSWLMN